MQCIVAVVIMESQGHVDHHGLLRGQRIRRLGLPDSFVEHGKQLQLRELVGLRSRGIARAAMELAREY